MNRMKKCAVVFTALLVWLGGRTGAAHHLPPQSGGEAEEIHNMEPVVLTQEEEKLLCGYIIGDRLKERIAV